MAANDLLVRIDGTSASFDAAANSAAKATSRLDAALKVATRAQEQLNAAVAQYGATSKQAVAAESAQTAALERVARAQTAAGIASKRAAEQQARDAATIKAASERQAAAQAAALRRTGTIAGSVGAAAAVALGLAAKAASDFDAKMAELQTVSRASATQLAALRDAAGGFADLGISASQAADAEIELSKAGLSVADITGGALRGSLALAAAGQIDVADATSIAAQAMTQFGLAGSDVGHIADLLSAGANKALGGVSDLGEGMKLAGLSAHQLGLSVDETVATLAEFAQAGLIGSQGGAAFQQMLLRLENPTAKSQELLDGLGISLYNAKGQFVGMADLAGQLQSKLGNLSQATRLSTLATIFGSRAVRAANILYQDGAKGVQEWQNKVEDSGNAVRTAAGKLNSAAGDWQKFTAEVENDAIAFGERLQPAIRGFLQTATGLSKFLGDLPEPLKDAAFYALALTTAVGAGIFVYSRAKTALIGLTTILRGTADAELAVGDAAILAQRRMLLMRGGAVIVGGTLLTMSQNTDKASDSFGSLTGHLTELGGAGILGGVFGPLGAGVTLVADAAKQSYQFGYTLGTKVKGGADQATASVGDLKVAVAGASREMRLLFGGQLARDTSQTKALIGTTAESVRQMGVAVADVGDHADGFDPLRNGADAAKRAVDGLSHSVAGLTHSLQASQDALSERAAFRDYQDSIAAVDKAQNHAKTTTRQMNEVLDAQASAAINVANTMKDGSQRQVTYLNAARVALYNQARQFGMTRAQAQAYVNEVLRIPPRADTRVLLSGAELARMQAAAIADQLARIQSKTVHINVVGSGGLGAYYGINQAQGGVVDYYANGGMRERHVAQIAPAGAMRVWAEPETGGEAYIPLAPSKRERSRSIAEETVRRLGGMAFFASGGLAGARSSTNVTVQPGRVTINIPGKALADAINRGADARIEATANWAGQ